MIVAAKRCSQCALSYPTVYAGSCLECDGALSHMNDEEPMSKEEFDERKALRRLRCGDAPNALLEKDKRALDSDLDAFLGLYRELEAEAERRGPRWSPVDIFEERMGEAA